jgi:SEC-C motif-containing protein
MIGLDCPCGSLSQLSECCGPLLSGSHHAETALRLMRSRYTAYCLRDGDYLRKTWHMRTRPVELDLRGDETAWEGLEIVRHDAGGADDGEGFVEFTALYRQGGVLRRLRERSHFVKESGEWFYLDGLVKSEPKQGRNDPCGCGSGKKYKKCCGLPLNKPTLGRSP